MLEPWLRGGSEPARYRLDVRSPEAAFPSASFWDVIVVDGGSFRSDDERERTLARARRPPHDLTAVLYLCGSSAGAREVERALVWADDALAGGSASGEPLQRWVRAVALAPWRRSNALRRRAELWGDRRLRVVGAPPPHDDSAVRPRPTNGHAAGRPAISKAAAASAARELLSEAFDEGRRFGVETVRRRAESLCTDLIAELERALVALRSPARASAPPSEPLSTASARFAGARDAVAVLRDELRRLTSEELTAIDHARSRSHER
jgi:hypothetical protein